MRKLMWFTLGFGGACGLGAYALSGDMLWKIALFAFLLSVLTFFFGSGGLSGAAVFCGFDFFVILFGKNGVLTHVILKKCDTASALQSAECDPYARACKRKQGVAPGGKWAGIGDNGASDALYSC